MRRGRPQCLLKAGTNQEGRVAGTLKDSEIESVIRSLLSDAPRVREAAAEQLDWPETLDSEQSAVLGAVLAWAVLREQDSGAQESMLNTLANLAENEGFPVTCLPTIVDRVERTPANADHLDDLRSRLGPRLRHQAVAWQHDFQDQPVVLYSEIDADGLELRKVDEYRSGHLDFASRENQTGTTRLSTVPMPSLNEINAQEEFSGELITPRVFETVWVQATLSSQQQG